MSSNFPFVSQFMSPKRGSMTKEDIENITRSPPLRDISMYPWNWGESAQNIQLSPTNSITGGSDSEKGDTPVRRGRPRAESITNLIIEGVTSQSSIKCKQCNRVFPREKSLQAHMRTHTGERPYICDYPGCTKAFCQSGQLKTHQRLHTGEKPFICSVTDCTSRFTHANRHCPDHPYAALKRCNEETTPSRVRNKESQENDPRGKTQKSSARMTLKRALDEQAHKEGIAKKQNTLENSHQKNILKEDSFNTEEQQKWLGALALMELACSAKNKS